jgi:hypothetical protein
MKNLLSVYEFALCTVASCISEGEGYGICPTILGETADHGGRRDDLVFPLLSAEGETTHAIQLLIMGVIVFVFIYRTIRYARYMTTTNERRIVPLGPKKIYEALVRRF